MLLILFEGFCVHEIPTDLLSMNSSDAESFSYQGAGATRPMRKLFAKAYHPERRPREKDRPLTETLYSITKNFDVSCGEFSNGRGRPVARRSSFGNPQSYEFWSSRLAQNFDFDLYNHFRRSALDDFFTRHFDYGFNALMEFYRNTLLGRGPIPDSVLKDMVCLSQKRLDCHNIVFTTIHDALGGRKMKAKNQKTVSKYFNIQHGKTPKEKLSP